MDYLLPAYGQLTCVKIGTGLSDCSSRVLAPAAYTKTSGRLLFDLDADLGFELLSVALQGCTSPGGGVGVSNSGSRWPALVGVTVLTGFTAICGETWRFSR